MKALIADDTKNIRTLLTNCLELEGYETKTAYDGLQALESLRNENFDLIFLDIKMPEISGTEVLKKIREQGIDTPVIIITAFATVKNAVECTKMGAVSYLQKPFTADKVRSVLDKFKNNQSDNILKQAQEFVESQDYEKAIYLLKRAIFLNPTNAEVFLLFSRAYKGMGNNELLVEKFYKAYQLFSE